MENMLAEIFGMLKDMLTAIWNFLADVVPIAIKFLLWVILGIIVLPCVFVAGNIYPAWVKWGEETF